MPEKKTCAIFLAINEDGDYEVAADDSTAIERLDENFGGYARRIISIVVKVSAPAYENPVAELDISDTAGRTEKVEVEAK